MSGNTNRVQFRPNEVIAYEQLLDRWSNIHFDGLETPQFVEMAYKRPYFKAWVRVERDLLHGNLIDYYTEADPYDTGIIFFNAYGMYFELEAVVKAETEMFGIHPMDSRSGMVTNSEGLPQAYALPVDVSMAVVAENKVKELEAKLEAERKRVAERDEQLRELEAVESERDSLKKELSSYKMKIAADAEMKILMKHSVDQMRVQLKLAEHESAKYKKELDRLAEELKNTRQQPPQEQKTASEELSTSKKNTLLTIIAALAFPGAALMERTSTGILMKKIQSAGMKLSENTVRDVLKEASEYKDRKVNG